MVDEPTRPDDASVRGKIPLRDIPVAPAEDHIRAFEKLGWTRNRRRGSHTILVRRGYPSLSIPDNSREGVSKKVIQRLLTDTNIPLEEYREAMGKK